MPTSHRHSRADKKRQSCAKKQKEPLGLISHAMQNSDRQIALPVSRNPVFRLTRRSNISFARDMQGNEQCQCSNSQVVSLSAKAFSCEAGGRHFLNIQIGRSSQPHSTMIMIQVRGAPDQGPNKSQTDSCGVRPSWCLQKVPELENQRRTKNALRAFPEHSYRGWYGKACYNESDLIIVFRIQRIIHART